MFMSFFGKRIKVPAGYLVLFNPTSFFVEFFQYLADTLFLYREFFSQFLRECRAISNGEYL